ncbi:hypothetical protein FKP32DRAFT_1610016 [Trametes sanguinea]|nr:hypothetical protein FKP32DRAFT_1610016 [Trametes sanguinea]
MAIPLFPWFRWAVIISIATLGAHARDIAVDDSNSAISYSPADQCDCTIHPDASKAFDGTWHDTTQMTITFSFTGTAIQVFNILPPVVPSAPTTHTDLTFILDDLVVSSGADFQYNVRVFSQDNLDNKAHTLVIQTTGGIESVVLFDYLVYTTPPPITTITSDPLANATTSTTSTKVITVSSSRGSSSSTSSTSLPPSTSSAPIPSSGSSTSSQASHSEQSAVPALVPSQISDHASKTEGGLTSTSSGDVTSETSTFPSATAHPQTKSTTGTIPLSTVIGVAVGGGLALLILTAALVYILCRDPFADPAPGVRLPDGTSGAGSHERPSSELEDSIIVIGEATHISSLAPSLLPTHDADANVESPLASRTPSQQYAPSESTSVSHASSQEDKPLLPTAAVDVTLGHSATAEPVRPSGRQLPPVPNPLLLEHLAALEEEVAWLRANREANILIPDDLPRYDEVRS